MSQNSRLLAIQRNWESLKPHTPLQDYSSLLIIQRTEINPMRRIVLSDDAHFWLNGFVNKQNMRWTATNPQLEETPLHPPKVTVLCEFYTGGCD